MVPDDTIAETTTFQEVRARAFEILERQKLAFLAEHIATQAAFDETAFQWEHVDTLARQFKCNLRPTSGCNHKKPSQAATV